MQVSLEINAELFNQIDKELAGLQLIARAPAIAKGLRRAGNVVKNRIRETLPKPGYPGDKKDLEPLRDATRTKVIQYPSGKIVAIVGYEWGTGSHGHNVEEGHRIAKGGTLRNPNRKTPPQSKITGERGKGINAGFVKGRFDIANAARSTQAQQANAISTAIQEAIQEIKAR